MLTSSQQPHADALVRVIHWLHAKGWAPATSSNYSFRLHNEPHFAVSASGIDKGTFVAADFITVDAAGVAINDARTPSAETLLHCLIYRRLPHTAFSVVHAHTVANTALSYAEAANGKITFSGFELQKAFAGISTHESTIEIPIFANNQDIAALAMEIDAYWETHPEMPAFLLAGHGLYTWGDSIAAAKRHLEACEFLFETKLALHRYGFPTKG